MWLHDKIIKNGGYSSLFYGIVRSGWFLIILILFPGIDTGMLKSDEFSER